MKPVKDNCDNNKTEYSIRNITVTVPKITSQEYDVGICRKCVLQVFKNKCNQKITSKCCIKESLCNFALAKNRITVDIIKN